MRKRERQSIEERAYQQRSDLNKLIERYTNFYGTKPNRMKDLFQFQQEQGEYEQTNQHTQCATGRTTSSRAKTKPTTGRP
jgi:hypothetical protein